MLERNNDNITAALKGLAKYQITQAEAVNSGFLYNAFVANLSPGQIAQPFFDYALGFRRGVDAGQPPDNAGPRAEIPFPTTAYRNPTSVGAAMTRRKPLTIAVAVILALLVAGGIGLLVRQAFFKAEEHHRVLHQRDRHLSRRRGAAAGVKVGTIKAIQAQGTKTKFSLAVDRDVPIPANAQAIIVSQNLVGARYVQLTPPYEGQRSEDVRRRGDRVGPHRRAGRGDQVKTQLMRLATDLGPKDDASKTAVGRFIDSAANALDGNGQKLHDTIAQLSGVSRARRQQRQPRRHHQEPADLRHGTPGQQCPDRPVPGPPGQPHQRGRRQPIRPGRGIDQPVQRGRRRAAVHRRRAETRPPSNHST